MCSPTAFKLKDEIIALYKSGCSQKDIMAKCGVPLKDIREILRENGIETFRFRALDDNVTNIIILLVKSGIQFKDIEHICEISFHAIRDVVARNSLQRASKRARSINPNLSLPDGYERNQEFAERYLAGESFCSLCGAFNLNNEEILYEFLSIDENQVSQHGNNLEKLVLADADKKLSVASIAKKHTISTSIVRKYLS